MGYEEEEREMDAQAARNGYMHNPNHSNERYMERNENELKAAAFRSKEGYCQKDFSSKLKDQMNGMPMPRHMRGG